MTFRMRLGLTLASAIAIVLCFPPTGWWGLVLLAWTPFFMVVRELHPRQALWYGLLHGLVAYAISLSWLWHIFSAGAVALWLVLAAFSSLWAWYYAKLSESKNRFTPFLAAVLWTGLEYFRGEVSYLSFSWITPGTALPPNLVTPLLGVYGVTFFVVLSGLLLVEPGKKTEISGLVIALLVLVAVVGQPNPQPLGSRLKVAAVQKETGDLEGLLAASSVLPGYVDLILWPEYALARDPAQKPETEQEIISLLQKRAKLLVAGGPTISPEDDDTWFNTAFTFSKDGVHATHYKNHPVHLIQDGKPGTEARAFDSPLGRLGTPVCFDCDHQDITRKMTQDGAQLLLVPVMNMPEWTARQHRQHGQLLRHRAAENGRWMVSAANTGTTQIVDEYGNVLTRLPLGQQDTMVGEVGLKTHLTPFTRGGWYFGPVTMIASFVILVIASVKGLRRRWRLADAPDS